MKRMLPMTLIVVSSVALLILARSSSLYAVKSIQSNWQERSSLQGAVINGTVINLEGQTIAEADVSAVSARGSIGRRPHTLTDSKGNFTITGLKPGTYFIGAENESDGYASNRDSFTFAGLAAVPQVVLSENQVVSSVTLRLGPKSAKLTGQVIDAKTRRPVEVADIVLRRADNQKYFYAIGLNDPKVNNRFKVLVPPLPFTIEVKAVGYEDWTYSKDGTGKHMDPLKLASGERRDLTIALGKK